MIPIQFMLWEVQSILLILGIIGKLHFSGGRLEASLV